LDNLYHLNLPIKVNLNPIQELSGLFAALKANQTLFSKFLVYQK